MKKILILILLVFAIKTQAQFGTDLWRVNSSQKLVPMAGFTTDTLSVNQATARGSISSSATGLSYSNITGVLSWASGYEGFTTTLKNTFNAKILKDVMTKTLAPSGADYTEFKTAVEALTSGQTLFIYKGIYSVTPVGDSAGVILKNKNNIRIIAMSDSVVIKYTGLGNVFMIQNCNWVEVRGITYQGNHKHITSSDGAMRIYGNGSHITIEKCKFYAYNDQGIAMLSDASHDGCDFVTIRDCYFNGGGDYTQLDGAAIDVSGKNWTIDNITVEGCFRGIEIFAPTSYADTTKNITIKNSKFINVGDYGIVTLFGTGLSSYHMSDILVSECHFQGGGSYAPSSKGAAILITGGERVQLTSNNIKYITGYGFSFNALNTPIADSFINNNIIRSCTENGIQTDSTSYIMSDISITGNRVSYCTKNGIYIARTHLANVMNNVCTNNDQAKASNAGIYVNYAISTNAQIIGNICYDTQGANNTQNFGIHIGTNVPNAMVYCNRTKYNREAGIQDDGASTDKVSNKTN